MSDKQKLAEMMFEDPYKTERMISRSINNPALRQEMLKKLEQKQEYAKLYKFIDRLSRTGPEQDAPIKQVFIFKKSFMGPYLQLDWKDVIDSVGYNFEEFRLDDIDYIQCTLKDVTIEYK